MDIPSYAAHMTSREYLTELCRRYRSHLRNLDERGRLLQRCWLAELLKYLRQSFAGYANDL